EAASPPTGAAPQASSKEVLQRLRDFQGARIDRTLSFPKKRRVPRFGGWGTFREVSTCSEGRGVSGASMSEPPTSGQLAHLGRGALCLDPLQGARVATATAVMDPETTESPLLLLEAWLTEAARAGQALPEAMTLATVG